MEKDNMDASTLNLANKWYEELVLMQCQFKKCHCINYTQKKNNRAKKESEDILSFPFKPEYYTVIEGV